MKRSKAGRKKGTTRTILVQRYVREAKAGIEAIRKLVALANGS